VEWIERVQAVPVSTEKLQPEGLFCTLRSLTAVEQLLAKEQVSCGNEQG